MAWWMWLLTGWVLLAVLGAVLLGHRIGSADRRERALRAHWTRDHQPGQDRLAV